MAEPCAPAPSMAGEQTLNTWFTIALRNLVKNRRRSLITMTAIAVGYAAVNLFGGFTNYMYRANREAAIYVKGQGHLTIFKKGFLEQGRLDPTRYLLGQRELDAIKRVCRAEPHVVLATPQLNITGLLSNGQVSTIFIGQGLVPSDQEVFRRHSKLLTIVEYQGAKLRDDKPYGVGVARGLAKLLNLHIGSDAVALATTVDGLTNALDLEVVQIIDVDIQALNNKIIQVPLAFAQNLYDTKGADRVAVLLDRTENTEGVRRRLQTALAAEGIDVTIKTWRELSLWYNRVRQMFDVIFLFIFFIVFVIVVMSVINTMSMAVLERTREIGTLRALGLKRRGVIVLFSLESALLGVMGSLLGVALTACGWLYIHLSQPRWTPPGITRSVPLRIECVPEYLAASFLALVLLCLIASTIPARKGAKKNVVDALGHV